MRQRIRYLNERKVKQCNNSKFWIWLLYGQKLQNCRSNFNILQRRHVSSEFYNERKNWQSVSACGIDSGNIAISATMITTNRLSFDKKNYLEMTTARITATQLNC